MMTVEFRGVTFAYRGSAHPVLDTVDFVAERGSLTAVVGPSGCGKSTLLYIAGLMLRTRAGVVALNGTDTTFLADWERSRLRAKSVGFVFQDAALDPTRSVLDNVLEPTVYRGDWSRDRRMKALHLLHQLGVELEPRRRPGQLSGGQAQRVALCRAMIGDPSVVLADEPTGNLDDKNARSVVDVLDGCAKRGATVVVVTHDPRVIGRCDHTVSLP
jgi:ABC-type lipoprotein export system ATPase subunit